MATVDMGKAELTPARIPVKFEGLTAVDRPITVGGEEYRITCVSMGNPHGVVFCKSPDAVPLETVGRSLNTTSCSPSGSIPSLSR